MKRTVLAITSIILLASTSLMAQGRGRGPTARGNASARTSPGSAHSNAPAGTPAASADRDFGRERAMEVGKGKKKGLHKINPETAKGKKKGKHQEKK